MVSFLLLILTKLQERNLLTNQFRQRCEVITKLKISIFPFHFLEVWFNPMKGVYPLRG
jgi:hypothetical protein